MTPGTPRRGPRLAGHRGMLAAAFLAASLAVTGCGSKPSPLGQMSDAQRTSLDAAWSAIINATDPVDLTPTDRASRAKTLYSSCSALDKSSALQTAIADLCTPTYAVTKLDGILPTRCATASAQCVRALDRRADATADIVVALDNLTSQAKAAIVDPACRSTFTSTQPTIQDYRNLASAYRVLSLGVTQRAKDISGLGQRQVDEAKALIADKRTASQRMAAFRTACGLS